METLLIYLPSLNVTIPLFFIISGEPQLTGESIQAACSDFIMIWRAYVIWGHSRRILVVLAPIFVVALGEPYLLTLCE